MHGIKFTQEEYIEKCKKFNPEYDYSEINFTTIKDQFVTPICKNMENLGQNTTENNIFIQLIILEEKTILK